MTFLVHDFVITDCTSDHKLLGKARALVDAWTCTIHLNQSGTNQLTTQPPPAPAAVRVCVSVSGCRCVCVCLLQLCQDTWPTHSTASLFWEVKKSLLTNNGVGADYYVSRRVPPHPAGTSGAAVDAAATATVAAASSYCWLLLVTCNKNSAGGEKSQW